MSKEIKELIEIGIELKEKSSNEKFVVGRLAGQVAIIHKDKYETINLQTLSDANLFERIKTDKEKELEKKLEIANSILKDFEIKEENKQYAMCFGEAQNSPHYYTHRTLKEEQYNYIKELKENED